MIATICMCSLEFDEAYIDHFLAFYDSQGVDIHILILHSKWPSHEKYITNYYSPKGVLLYFHYGDWNADIARDIKHKIIKEFSNRIDWFINSDMDEQILPSCGTLTEKIQQMENNGQNCCWGKMIDRISKDGDLPKIKENIPLCEQFELESSISKNILRCDTRKVAISKSDILIGSGNHRVMPEYKSSAVFNAEMLKINHYKWSKNIRQKLYERIINYEGKFPHVEESKRFLNFWEDFGNLNHE